MANILDFQLPEHLRSRQTAKRRESGVLIASAVVAVACVAGAGFFLAPMNKIRQDHQLVIDPSTLQGLPPDLALLGKLGTFRALAIDWASIRAERLKEEGKTYEALQLHQTVCALAPRFPTVWINAAWNMAYNISVMQYTPEARWKWVRNGITLLRDKGIRYNPTSVAIYKELAWIYWHKIGDILDDEHLNYKKALAIEMEQVLGPPPITIEDEEYFAWFREIVDAPRDLDALIRDDPKIASLVARLEATKLRPDESLLDFVARYLRPELKLSDLIVEGDEERNHLLEKRLALLTDDSTSDARDKLLAAIRAKTLEERHKFDLDYMYKLMERYGPLDWRNAFAHTLYWSSYADEKCRERATVSRTNAINTARLIFFALQTLIDRGRMVLYPNFDEPFESYLEMSPDTRYIPYLYDTYMRLGKAHFHDHPDFVEGTPGPNYMNGFVTAMHNWIQYLYFAGGRKNLDLAENYFAWLRENNPHPDGSTQSRYLKTLDAFVMDDVLNQLHTYRAAGGLIRSLVTRGLKHYSLNQRQEAVTMMERAKQCRDYWMKDTDTDRNERMHMQAFNVILRDQIEQYVTSPTIDPLFKARLWKYLPPAPRQVTYDALLPYFERLCAAQKPPWSTEAAFPEPVGMEKARQRKIKTIGKPKKDVGQGEGFKR